MDDHDKPTPAAPPADWAAQLLGHWFDPATKALWFNGGDAFDADVRARYGDWVGALRHHSADAFLDGAATALAAVILFDQVPRNIHRGHADAFATDHLALAIAREAVAHGYDSALDSDQRLFVYLPFEHSEDAGDQREAVRLISALGNDQWTRFALDHQAMIEKFGRFPHRNASLGRESTQEELDYLASGGFSG